MLGSPCGWVGFAGGVLGLLSESTSRERPRGRARSYLDDVPTAKIVFVAYGPGVDFLLEDAEDRHNDPYDYAILRLVERGVDFRVCAATLAAREITKAGVSPHQRTNIDAEETANTAIIRPT